MLILYLIFRFCNANELFQNFETRMADTNSKNSLSAISDTAAKAALLDSNVITLNVGGTKFMILKSTVTSGIN